MGENNNFRLPKKPKKGKEFSSKINYTFSFERACCMEYFYHRALSYAVICKAFSLILYYSCKLSTPMQSLQTNSETRFKSEKEVNKSIGQNKKPISGFRMGFFKDTWFFPIQY